MEGSSVHQHQIILAAIFLVLGIFAAIGILVLLFIFGFGSAVLFTVGAEDPDIPGVVKLLPAGFGLFISIIIALTGIPNFIAAYGLFKNRPWKMTVALLAGILNLPSIPLGTAAGIYAIWVYAHHRDVTPPPVVV
jgi:hypothetical protein